MVATPTGVSGASSASACRSEEHTSELQSQSNLVCRLLLEKKKQQVQDDFLHRARPPHDPPGIKRSAHRTILSSCLLWRPTVYVDRQRRYGDSTLNDSAELQ